MEVSSDIRMAFSFRTHPKRVKLQKRLGAEAVLAFLDLLLFAGESKPDGALTGMTVEDISIAAQWSGDDEILVSALLEIGLLDRDENGALCIHNWRKRNSYVANSASRSAASSRAAHIRWLKERGTTCTLKTCEHCAPHATRMRSARKRNAPVPSPAPAPTPTPIPKEDRRARATSKPKPFEVTAEMSSWAAETCPTVDIIRETPKFLDHHEAKGSRFVSWEKAWQTWMRRAAEWAPRNGNGSQGGIPTEAERGLLVGSGQATPEAVMESIRETFALFQSQAVKWVAVNGQPVTEDDHRHFRTDCGIEWTEYCEMEESCHSPPRAANQT